MYWYVLEVSTVGFSIVVVWRVERAWVDTMVAIWGVAFTRSNWGEWVWLASHKVKSLSKHSMSSAKWRSEEAFIQVSWLSWWLLDFFNACKRRPNLNSNVCVGLEVSPGGCLGAVTQNKQEALPKKHVLSFSTKSQQLWEQH